MLEDYQQQQQQEEMMYKGGEEQEQEDFEFKVYISRVPTSFDETIVKRIILEALQTSNQDCILDVSLIYTKEEEEEEENEKLQQQYKKSNKHINFQTKDDTTTTKKLEHRGFGFVAFSTLELQNQAIQLQTIRGGQKVKSKKKHTMYIRPYLYNDDTNNDFNNNEKNDTNCNDTLIQQNSKNICYLWTQKRCPYGNECKFDHIGPGGTVLLLSSSKENNNDTKSSLSTKNKQKCLQLKSKGKCSRINCPFSHDFEPVSKVQQQQKQQQQYEPKPKSEKNCISWKTKGKCKKGDACPYRHDVELQQKALNKKKKRQGQETKKTSFTNNNDNHKQKQPLSIRVFGIPFSSSKEEIHDLFSKCGKIVDMDFPCFEDSGRNKGFCYILYPSPKAVEKAITEYNEMEYGDNGRWLQVEAVSWNYKQMKKKRKIQHDKPQQAEEGAEFDIENDDNGRSHKKFKN